MARIVRLSKSYRWTQNRQKMVRKKKKLAVLSPFALYQVIKLFRLSTSHTYSTFRFSFIGETTMWIYYNMTIGIKDESVFIPPKMCFKNVSIVLCGFFLFLWMWHIFLNVAQTLCRFLIHFYLFQGSLARKALKLPNHRPPALFGALHGN